MLREKKAVPSAVGHDPHRQPVGRIRPGVEVLDEQLAALQVSEQALVQAGELVGRDRLIDLAPGHCVLGARLLDDVFVPRGAAGEQPGRDREAAA